MRRLIGLALLLAWVGAGCTGPSRPRISFQIVAYRFNGGDIEVDSQQPGDPGCFAQPRLDLTNRPDGLHVGVTYRKTNQRFCILPCPITPLTQRQRLPAGSAGRPVVLDRPRVTACIEVTGGPVTVPIS